MGELCPTCGTHQAYKRSLTVTGGPAAKASEVFGRELACGHQLGGEAYERYVKKAAALREAAAQKHLDTEAKLREDLLKAYAEGGSGGK